MAARNALNTFDLEFPDAAAHANYLGRGLALWEKFFSHVREPDPRYHDFHGALSPFREGGKELMRLGGGMLTEPPTGEEASHAEFEQKRRDFRNSLDDLIAWRNYTVGLPQSAITGELRNAFLEERYRQKQAALAPAPAVATTTSTTLPPAAAPAWAPNWVR
jgi:hypothetical protein